jgi:hypothetical protein
VRYDVVWAPEAEDELAALWLASTDRPAFSRAVAAVEAALERQPLYLGTPLRSSVQRFLWNLPVGVEFEVVEDDKRVIVLNIFAAP